MRVKVIEIAPGQTGSLIRALVLSGQCSIGKVYTLTENTSYSHQQRKLFEPLVRIFFNSMCIPDQWVQHHNIETWEDLREVCKLKLGEGVELYEYVDNQYKIHRIEKLEDVPGDVLDDFHHGNHERIRIYRLKSTTKYTVKQMHNLTDSLSRQMIYAGVGQSKFAKKFNDILHEIGFTE
jgi:hypothetical protein